MTRMCYCAAVGNWPIFPPRSVLDSFITKRGLAEKKVYVGYMDGELRLVAYTEEEVQTWLFQSWMRYWRPGW